MAEIVVNLDPAAIERRVNNDKFGLLAAGEWKRLIDPYTPHLTGQLQSDVTLSPFEIEYNSKYAHYIYTGEVYVDPLYHVGGFNNDEYGWWSRPGVKKIPSGRSFRHYTTNTNPMATDHWDTVAANAGQVDKLVQTLNDALDSGNY